MLRHIDDSMNSWQRPGLRHRLIFALLSMLIALSYSLLLDCEEAEAKGEKQSPSGGSAEGPIGGSTKPAQDIFGEVNKLASNEGGKDGGSPVAGDPAPRADKPTPVENGTVRDAISSTNTNQVADKAPSVVDPLPETSSSLLKPVGSLGEVAGTAREETRPAIEPLLNRAVSEAAPILERTTPPVRPVLDETASTVEPLLDTVSPEIKPILERATAPVSPVLERTISTVEPLFREANPPVEPALAEPLPAVEPVLDGAVPVVDEPVGEVFEPIARPLGEAAIPIAGPIFEDAASPDAGLAFGVADPVFKSVFETAAPVVGAGRGEGIVRHYVGPPVLNRNVGASPASLSALQSRTLAVEVRDLLGSARDYGPVHEESPASVVESPGAHSSLFNVSFVIDGSHAALLDAIRVEDARQEPPHPFPFEFPPAAPPVGVSFGSSSSVGVTLAILAILALLPILPQVGGLSWSTRAAFKLDSSLRLTVERPG